MNVKFTLDAFKCAFIMFPIECEVFKGFLNAVLILIL